jgi:diguanylate cyclase (GGDEF)-like protein
LVARLGGEEFVILLCETSEDGARALAEALRKLLNRSPLTVNGLVLSISASFGVSSLGPGQDGSLDKLYSSADQALYRAKQAGRNRVA